MNIIFGDSFIGPFNLLDDNNLYIKKFKGKNIRGISKLNTDDYNTLKNIIIDKQKYNKINYVIFMFGQGDIYIGIYYLILFNKTYNISEILQETAEKYIKMLLSLDMINNKQKIVFSIFPSLQEDNYAFYDIFVYSILDKNELINKFNKMPKKFKDFIFSYKFRNNCRMYLNNLIKILCKKNNIKYIDYDNILIDKKTNKINENLNLKVNEFNVHPIFENMIYIYLSKLKFTNIKHKFKDNLNDTKNEYLKNKEKEIKSISDNENILNIVIPLENKINNNKNNKKYDDIYNILYIEYKKMKKFNKTK